MSESLNWGTGQLPLHPALSSSSQKGNILKNLQSTSLISIGPLCDNRCAVVLTDKDIAMVRYNEVVLCRWCYRTDNMWDIPLINHKISTPNCKLPIPHPSLYFPHKHQICPPELNTVNGRKNILKRNNKETSTQSKVVNHLPRSKVFQIVEKQA